MAVYPRISISHSVIEKWRSDPSLRVGGKDLDNEDKVVLDMIRDSSTGPWIDYMAIIKANADDELVYCEFCSLHADKIRENLTEFGDNPEVMRKFLWLAAYHNKHIAPYLDDTDGSPSDKCMEADGYDGLKTLRNSKIDAPYGWTLPTEL